MQINHTTFQVRHQLGAQRPSRLRLLRSSGVLSCTDMKAFCNALRHVPVCTSHSKHNHAAQAMPLQAERSCAAMAACCNTIGHGPVRGFRSKHVTKS